MRDYLDLAPVPVDEPCAMVGSYDYHARARAECFAFCGQLKRAFPEALKAGVTFRIKWNPNDFGSYLEVQACFDDENEEQTEWAYLIENELPESWDDTARAQLAAEGYMTVPRSEFWTMGA